MKQYDDILIQADLAVLQTMTAPDPTADEPGRLSSVGLAVTDAMGEQHIMLSVVDGTAKGSVAFLNRIQAISLLQMYHKMVVTAGFLPDIEDMTVE